ncbi:glycosylphosphatidylinositol-anchored merozoite surface protein [Babesia divergens]|uniref:Glycosylphosphatidylinositol-anchored merozoite surface protein n=1 Tax=Babesia divergens TaxID=32595 RepID=A0AAD9G6R7_BABDI|nr:glycosylphosphatidylinositol-anchored merozoite surface protein [Babesia divergens]
MKFLGILRASALCLLISAFCSQHVSCGLFSLNKKPKETDTVEKSESSGSPEESGVRSSGSENTSQNSAPSAYERELDEQLRIMAEQRKEAVERLLESDAPFSFKDMELFLGVLKKGADVDPETVKKVGEKIHAYLKSIGIHGGDVKSALETLVIKIHKSLMDLVYGPLDIDIFNPTESTVKPQDPTESSGDSEVEAEKKAEDQ